MEAKDKRKLAEHRFKIWGILICRNDIGNKGRTGLRTKF